MRLTKKKFESLLKENKLVLSLIGMSNIGKTYWSKQLNHIGFKHFNCDSLIEEKLSKELKNLGYKGIADVSKWMGQPYNKRYAKNQDKYLNIEKRILQDILNKIQKQKNKIRSKNIVIDTTGSFAHCGDELCRKIKKDSLIVYLEATDKMREEMFQRYIKDPKPVVFGDIFSQKKSENDLDALKRSYRILLNNRAILYAKYADIVIPFKKNKFLLNVDDFINSVKDYL